MIAKKLICCLFIVVSLVSKGQVNKDSIFNSIKNKLTNFPNNFYLAIALIQKDKVYHLGFKKQQDTVYSTTLGDTLFEIGSITKTFTATLLAQELIANKIEATDYINKVYPFKFNNKIKLTYLSLCNHTAGLYRLPSNMSTHLFNHPKNPYSAYNHLALEEYLKKELTLDQDNIGKLSYSNLGAGLLGYTLAKKEKTAIELLTKEKILDSYLMSSTAYHTPTSIAGLDKQGNPTPNWNMNALKAAGGLISTTNDLSKLIKAHFNVNNKALALTRKPTYGANKKRAIGMGWMINNPETEKEIFWHNGGTGGFSSCLSFSTRKKTGAIVLSNISRNHQQAQLIDQLCFELIYQLNNSN